MKKRKFIVSIDFDKTVVTDRFPKVGLEAPGVVEVLKKWKDKIDIILYTVRDHSSGLDPQTGKLVKVGPGIKSSLQEAIDWYSSREIPLYGVNQNPTQRFWNSSKKIYTDLIIDDRGAGIPMTTHPDSGEPVVDWWAINEILEDLLGDN